MTKESVALSRVSGDENRFSQKVDSKFRIPFLPIGGELLSRQTSSTHGPDGFITTDPSVIEKTIDRLGDKLRSSVEEFSFFSFYEEPKSSILLIAYGVTARAAVTAVSCLKTKGKKVSLLIIKTLYPVPEKIIKQALAGKSRVVVVEMNTGQYVREIERLATTNVVHFYGRMNGELITPEEIMAEVSE